MRALTKILVGVIVAIAVVNLFIFGYEIKREISLNKYASETGVLNALLVLEKRMNTLPTKAASDKASLEKKLQQVNVIIKNKTQGSGGSGVSLKYKGSYYILSAGHMMRDENDKVFLYENDQEVCELEMVKHDFYWDIEEMTCSRDLLLLQPKDRDIVPKNYVELADKEITTSTEVYIVGNPLLIEDVVSDGRVIKYKNNFFYYINHTYYGNSGGGVYTRDGKLVGIVSHLIPIQPVESTPAYMVFGAVRLDVIKHFLKNIVTIGK